MKLPKWELVELYKWFRDKYWKNFNKKKNVIKPKWVLPTMTEHAKLRFSQRFDWCGHTFEEVMNDVKKWWRTIRAWNEEWKFTVLWKIWKYVISRDMTIITMSLLDSVK